MSSEAETLPLAHVKRVVRARLAEVAGDGGAGDKKREVAIQKDALAALAEAGRIFIHYLTGTANELCQESKRLTINADDVMRALDEIEFAEFAEPLRETLAGAWSRDSTRTPVSRQRSATAGAVASAHHSRWRLLTCVLPPSTCALRAAFKTANAEKQANKAASKKRKPEGDPAGDSAPLPLGDAALVDDLDVPADLFGDDDADT